MSKKAKSKSNTDENKETLIYCGPPVRKVGLQQFAVFRDGLPEHIEKFAEENPVIKALFVKPGDFARVRHNIKTAGTREHQLYLKVLEFAEGGN